MSTRFFRRLALAVGLACSSVLVSACYMEADYPEYEDGYEPQFYDGYVVYYDDYGRPYYYVGDAAFWVPPTAPVYVGLVNHWRIYRAQYRVWYFHRGWGYRHYHGYGFHGGYHGGFHGGFHGGGHHGHH